jgi:hypothetical protein
MSDREWRVECYGSGTVVVMLRQAGVPHYYVLPHADDDGGQRKRRDRARELADWFNGGAPAEWMRAALRYSAAKIDYPLFSVLVTGPAVADGKLDDSYDAQINRGLLADALENTRRPDDLFYREVEREAGKDACTFQKS